MRTLIALVPLGYAMLLPGIAAADPPTFPILPNQYFSGVVNGSTTRAVVYTVCPGPSTGRQGHPAGGQTLAVARVSSPTPTDNIGFTGSAGTSVAASPVSSSTVNTPLVFTEYLVGQALPTGWTVPCDGDGLIAFVPRPTSTTAKTAYAAVHYVNIAA
ncbi:MAG TPA: hypothetical protein VFC19_17745 [Candidatus Limnocylindrales bacterium]|nr:hypothetical protein [Candidatus Limnocylindrales bacterium]